MIAGPQIILGCPHCGALAKLVTIEMVDPVGAVSWTDGCQEIPGVPRQPNITRCAACKRVHWTGSAQQVGYLLPGTEPTEEQAAWHDLPLVETVDEEGYYEALRDGLAPYADQEAELRVFAWWRGADRYRKCDEPVRYPTSPVAVANLERLAELLLDGEHEMVLFRAEALRQLGRFHEAQQALYNLCSDYALARQKQEELLAAKSRDLEILFA